MKYTVGLWNVQESSDADGRIEAQLEEVGSWGADLVVLRAVRRSWLECWREGLEALGYEFVFDTSGWADVLAESEVWPHGELSHHKVSVTASRHPARATGPGVTEAAYREAGLYFPERVLAVDVELPTTPETTLQCWNVGIVPGVSMGEEKVRMFEFVYERLAGEASHPRLLAGDFNSPKTERDGRKIPWGADKPDYIRRRWQEAESKVLDGLEAWGFRDVFKACQGTDLVETETGRYRDGCYSHLNPLGGEEPTRRRFDHVLASREFTPLEAEYRTEVMRAREDNGAGWSYLSDHAPLVVELEV
jgi:hypothetical protein